MNAPGPSNRRKRWRDEHDETDNHKPFDGFMDDESEPHKFGTAVLPVANLPNSFDGVPQDGMEYLFTVRREEKRLPLVTRVHNPYSVNYTTKQPLDRDKAGTTNVPSALPTEEWRTCFTERFRNFRANIRQPTIHISLPRLATSAPRIPDMRERDRWWAFFRGDLNWEKIPSSEFHTKKYGTSEKTTKQVIDYEEELPKGKGKLRGWVVYDEQLSWDQADEEDLAALESHSDAGPSDSGRTEELDRSRDDAMPFDAPSREDKGKNVATENALPTPRGSPNPQVITVNSAILKNSTPREPTPEVLDLLDQKITLHILKYFTQWIRGHFDRSALPAPPQIFDARPHTSRETRVYDLTATHARWMFALLSRLDEQLTSEEISVLRKLAREVMRVIREVSSNEACSRASSAESSMGVAACWIIVAAVAGVWGQRDLWMDVEELLR